MKLSSNRKNISDNENSLSIDFASESRHIEHRKVELGAFVECVSLRYLVARYENLSLDTELGFDETVVDGFDRESISVYLLRYIPETCTAIAVEGIIDSSLTLKDLALFTLLLLNVNGKALYPKFKVSDLREELSCRWGEEKEIRLQVKLLRERKYVLPLAKFYKIQKHLYERKSLWKSESGESKVLTMFYNLKCCKQGRSFEQNDIRPQIPKPGLKEEFDLREASEKVITLLSRLTLCDVWSPCSSNIYGESPPSTLSNALAVC